MGARFPTLQEDCDLDPWVLVVAATGRCGQMGQGRMLSVDSPQPFGCQSNDVGCDDVLAYAAPTADDQCVQFPDACTPARWVPCDPGAEEISG